MRDYRVRIRVERIEFFEELMRSLDFCDYVRLDENVGATDHSNVKLRGSRQRASQKIKKDRTESNQNFSNDIDNIREVISKIEARRDESRRREI